MVHFVLFFVVPYELVFRFLPKSSQTNMTCHRLMENIYLYIIISYIIYTCNVSSHLLDEGLWDKYSVYFVQVTAHTLDNGIVWVL